MEEKKRDYEKERNDLADEILEARYLRESQFPEGAKKWNFNLNRHEK